MKKTLENTSLPEMRDEYDFLPGIRGKYSSRYAKGTNVVVLDPDVAKVFPDAGSVNSSLRALASIIQARQHPTAGK